MIVKDILNCETKWPLRVIFNGRIGMRGQIGRVGLVPEEELHKKIVCGNCGQMVITDQMNLHIVAECPYSPAGCGLCNTKIRERQYLLAHMISKCPEVNQCNKCLTFYRATENHICLAMDLAIELKLNESTIPEIQMRKDGIVEMQIGSQILCSQNPINIADFHDDDIDQTLTTTFQNLPNVRLDLFYHKRMIACSDQIGLYWFLIKLDNQSFYYSSELLPSTHNSYDRQRLIHETRIAYSPYRSIEMNA